MRTILTGAAIVALLAACAEEAPKRQAVQEADVPQPSGPPVPGQNPPRTSAPAAEPAAVWETVASGEGTALRLTAGDGALRMSIACLTGPTRLAVNVPSFEPVMSEDRFALGLGEEPVTLVANPYEHEARPGVTGEGPVPDNLAALLEEASDVRALYGAQETGPYPAPSSELKDLLIDSCSDAAG